MTVGIENSALAEPKVTIIVTPRERFGMAQRSLESIYETVSVAFRLVYVDARSPQELSNWIAAQAKSRSFSHLKLDRFVSPNEARNLGVAASRTTYVVFIDNDVICAPGWLEKLIECADETNADVVAPLICEGLPLHTRVHQAGGAFAADPKAFFATPRGERDLIDEMYFQGESIENVRPKLARAETQNCEFHCVMARRSIFDRIGPLDEAVLATKEHLDFCMSVIQASGKVMFEPDSVVTYVFPNRQNPITKEDQSYFLLRWSAEWQNRSLDRLQQKWGLKKDGYVQGRRQDFAWRHFEGIIKPRLTKMPFIGRNKLWLRIGNRLLRARLNREIAALSAEYDRQQSNGNRQQVRSQERAESAA